jgi:hypothetical protein
MAGEEKTGGAVGLRGEAEAAGGKGRPELDLGKAGDERPAFQSLFQGPGGVLGRPGLDNKKARGVEAGLQQTGPVRAPPFPRRLSCQAPQDEAAAMCLYRFGDHGQGEAQGRRGVAIALRLELVEAGLLEQA